MDNEIQNLDFPVVVYGEMEKYSETLSKARCRIFYKGLNRNGTYITDEFANKLLSTISYAPVKGIYDYNENDYTDHGAARSLGRIYGIVPVDHNFAWEEHLDSDNITRTYACVDVLLYTALYEEAKQIPSKAESMELYKPSIKGEWKIMDGTRCYVFTDACFLGLQTLGEDTEPCFEGAAFYNLFELYKAAVINNNQSKIQKNGDKKMPEIVYALSDRKKRDLIWELLNPVNEEGRREWKYYVVDTYDDFALIIDDETQQYYKQYYTKNDETDSLELGNKEICYLLIVTEDEKKALDELKAQNNGSYIDITSGFMKIEDVNNKISEKDTKIEELATINSTLEVDKTNAENKITELNEQYTALNEKHVQLNTDFEALTAIKSELETYKKTVEDNKKKAIIDNYVTLLPEDVINSYLNDLDKYSCEELDMRLTYALKVNHVGCFSTEKDITIIPKTETELSGIASILSKYEKH